MINFKLRHSLAGAENRRPGGCQAPHWWAHGTAQVVLRKRTLLMAELKGRLARAVRIGRIKGDMLHMCYATGFSHCPLELAVELNIFAAQ